jgi:hypothetical protein
MPFPVRHSLIFAPSLLLSWLVPQAWAQRPLDLVRIHGTGGFLLQGNVGTSDFTADFSNFGQGVIQRTNGKLDVDPSFWGGIEGTYRLTRRLSVGASWMHSRGRLRVTFPALSRDPGDFDLEGFVLAASDFLQQSAFGGSRPERAMSDALTDVYMGSATYELPGLYKIFFPYATVGLGMFRQVSEGPVFKLEYEGALPPAAEIVTLAGGNWEREAFGLPELFIDETNMVASLGGGVRAALGSKWSAEVRIEDLIRISPGLENLQGSVPLPDPDDPGAAFRVFSVSVAPSDAALIHNFGVRLSLGYAVWPYGAPR